MDAYAELQKLVDKSHGVGLSGWDIQVLLREHYTDTYRIADLDDKSKPLGLVAVSATEGNRILDRMHHRIRNFKRYEVGKHYNMSLTEFLELPRDIVETILSELEQEELEAARIAARAEQEAKRLAQDPAARARTIPTQPVPGFNGFRDK